MKKGTCGIYFKGKNSILDNCNFGEMPSDLIVVVNDYGVMKNIDFVWGYIDDNGEIVESGKSKLQLMAEMFNEAYRRMTNFLDKIFSNI